MKIQFDAATGEYVIRVPAIPTPRPSESGKMMLLASSGGFVTTVAEHEGQPIKANVTLGFKPQPVPVAG
jgi:hypothetical protein